MPSCYYYDEQRNRCTCYVNENLNELLDENAKLREQVTRLLGAVPPDQREALLAGIEEDG